MTKSAFPTLATLLLTATLAPACMPAPIGDATRLPGQTQAEFVAWDALGGTGQPPTIYWVHESNCYDASIGPSAKGFDVDGKCLTGVTIEDPVTGYQDWSSVLLDPEYPFTDNPVRTRGSTTHSAMVHEMAHHLAQDHNTHPVAWFGAGGKVDQANALLRNHGIK